MSTIDPRVARQVEQKYCLTKRNYDNPVLSPELFLLSFFFPLCRGLSYLKGNLGEIKEPLNWQENQVAGVLRTFPFNVVCKNARRCARSEKRREEREEERSRPTGKLRVHFAKPAIKQSDAFSSFAQQRRLLFCVGLKYKPAASARMGLFVTRHVNRPSFRISIMSHYPTE